MTVADQKDMSAKLQSSSTRPGTRASPTASSPTIACPAWMIGYIKEQVRRREARASGTWRPRPTAANWGGSFLAVPKSGQAPEGGRRARQVADRARAAGEGLRQAGQLPGDPGGLRQPEAGRRDERRTSPTRRSARSSPTPPRRSRSRTDRRQGPDRSGRAAITDDGILQVEQKGKSAAQGLERGDQGRDQGRARPVTGSKLALAHPRRAPTPRPAHQPGAAPGRPGSRTPPPAAPDSLAQPAVPLGHEGVAVRLRRPVLPLSSSPSGSFPLLYTAGSRCTGAS